MVTRFSSFQMHLLLVSHFLQTAHTISLKFVQQSHLRMDAKLNFVKHFITLAIPPAVDAMQPSIIQLMETLLA